MSALGHLILKIGQSANPSSVEKERDESRENSDGQSNERIEAL